MSIKDWHEDDRPREKLLKLGAATLTDAEILAIFLRTGTKQQSAIEMARCLIDKFGSLANLLAAPQAAVLACHGIGGAKYAQIMASLELGKRYLNSQLKVGNLLNHSQMVKDFIATQLRAKDQELFAVLCLDTSLNLINYEILFIGGIDSCHVCIRHILRHALTHAASHIIIAHNHPQSDATPSSQDKRLTAELSVACQIVDIILLDHVIIGRNDICSFAESGLPPFN